MKRKIAVLLVIACAVSVLFCACGKDPVTTEPSATTTTATTTIQWEVLQKNEIYEKLKIVMEVNKNVAENPVYSVIDGKIGQIEFTCNGNKFVFRGAKDIDFSYVHGVEKDIDYEAVRSFDDGEEKFYYFTFTDGSRMVGWERYKGEDYAISCTLYTEAKLTDDEIQNVITTALKK